MLITGTADADTLVGGGSADEIVGLAGDDILEGLGGDDTIDGGADDDVLEGGPGRDTLNGGAGDDTLTGGDNTDALDGGEGVDTVIYTPTTVPVLLDLDLGTASFPTRTWATESIIGFENAMTGVGDDTLRGTGGANVLDAGTGANRILARSGDDLLISGAGDDYLSGGAGADTIRSGGGSDTVFGGSGRDVLDFTGLAKGLRVDLAAETATARDGSWQQEFSSIESVLVGSGDDRVTGTARADMLQGGQGDDTLVGGRGDDTLSGGELGARWNEETDGYYTGDGADLIRGGRGDDTLELIDIGSSSGSGATTRVDLTAGRVETTLYDGLKEIDRLTSIENVISGGTRDTLIGSDADNRLEGGGDLDEIRGGRGDDTLIGSGYYEAITDEEVLSENIYGGSGDDVIIANGQDRIYWHSSYQGQQYLSGGSGDHYIECGVSISDIRGGRGQDTFRFETTSWERNDTPITATTARIMDFEEGDLIEIEITEPFSDEDPEFIGEVDGPDQEMMKLFYQIETHGRHVDTRLTMYFTTGWDEDDDLVGLDILLKDYSGPVTEEDFAFV